MIVSSAVGAAEVDDVLGKRLAAWPLMEVPDMHAFLCAYRLTNRACCGHQGEAEDRTGKPTACTPLAR